MATVVRMPEVLANSGSAIIQTWLVSVGDQVSVGDPLAEIETEKAVVEYTAEVDGVVARLLAEPGVTIEVGEPIAVVAAPGEQVTDLTLDLPAATPAQPSAPASVDASAPELQAAQTSDARLFATPLVRKIARENGIDLSAVVGTGPRGRIVRRDVEQLSASAPQPPAAPAPAPPAPEPTPAVQHSAPTDPGANYVDIPLTGMRKAIARRLTESKSTVPHFYLTAHCRVDALLELRRTINATGVVKVSVNDFILKAVASALAEVPAANAIWNGDSIRQFDGVDLAVAVAVDDGLLTPVLRGVDKLSLSSVSSQVAELADRARSGRIHQHELEGGSFSVSNLGMYGVSEFTAILNPPQAGILAVGSAEQRPVVDNGQVTAATMLTVTLSADHRVIDGAVAAQWMRAFVRRIENPLTIMV